MMRCSPSMLAYKSSQAFNLFRCKSARALIRCHGLRPRFELFTKSIHLGWGAYVCPALRDLPEMFKSISQSGLFVGWWLHHFSPCMM
jgi:hypothetical protein